MISLYVVLAIILFNWMYQSPEERKKNIEEKLADYEEFQMNCKTYADWNVGRGGSTSLNSLYNDPQECLEKEIYIWKNDGSEITKGEAELVFDQSKYYFSEEELNDEFTTKEEGHYSLIESIQNECESTLISGFTYTYYFNGFDYIVEDSSGEKSKINENAFKALFKVSKESK